MKKYIITTCFFSTAFFMILFNSYILKGGDNYTYVGSEICKKCHSGPSMANQYSIWQSSPHAKAYARLQDKKAKDIAKKEGIKNPAESRNCLKCHTTGGGRSEITKEEGVGCEACHGPGSSYYEFANHVNYKNKINGYNKGKKHGMYPILDYEDNLKKREKLCMHCHDNNRPCMPVTKDEILKQKITIQVIDTLRKGDIDFSHPLRRY